MKKTMICLCLAAAFSISGAYASNVPGYSYAKRAACKVRGEESGARGSDLRDYVQICMAETRLQCTKDAVRDQIPIHIRRKHILDCLKS